MEKIRKDYPVIAPSGTHFSRAIRSGDFLFIAGCTARGTEAQGKPLLDQLKAVLDRIRRILEQEGASMTDIVRLTTYVTVMDEWRAHSAEVDAVFDSFFHGQFPPNSLVGVSTLARPGNIIEVEATAMY